MRGEQRHEHYDAYLLQELHVSQEKLQQVEAELAGAGFKGVLTAARQSDKTAGGTHGGTAVVVKGHLCASSFRHLAADPRAVSSATADTRAGSHEGRGFDMCDWTPMALHLKG